MNTQHDPSHAHPRHEHAGATHAVGREHRPREESATATVEPGRWGRWLTSRAGLTIGAIVIAIAGFVVGFVARELAGRPSPITQGPIEFVHYNRGDMVIETKRTAGSASYGYLYPEVLVMVRPRDGARVVVPVQKLNEVVLLD